ncbi:hypothetical protein EW146_g6394 [Bondarzewia mesenterica]|uniref:Uncharacterized protein n=1 Tax=Bondarzewia mesenterica TaxID=1095465 RepID=A0A4S4LNP8_9AGAM|nr:hypothetical protein EW146_g6394 [Bondarzewia mesenterica]
MSNFVEFRESSNEPSFVRPLDITRRRMDPSQTHSSRPSGSSSGRHTSMLTSATNQPRPPPPVEAISGIPTPVANVRGLGEEDYEAECMTVDPQADIEEGYQFSEVVDDSKRGKPKKRFVGGFVTNLKKLPKAVARNLLYDRRPPPEHYAADEGVPVILEPEDAPPYGAPGQPVEGGVHYVEAREMPVEDPAPLRNSHVRTSSRHSVHSMVHVSRSSSSRNTMQSPSHHSVRFPSSHRSSNNGLPRTVRNPDPEGDSDGSSTDQHNPDVPANQTAASPSHTGPPSPVLVAPKPASDYLGMSIPPPEPSLPSHVATVRKFFRDLADLPWMASNIAVDFVPAESARAQYPRPEGGPTSWYRPRRRNVDLLASGPQRGRARRRIKQTLANSSQHGHNPIHASSATLAYANQSALGHGSAEGAVPQPPSSLGHGQFPYPMPLPPPPPMFMYPTTMITPRVSPGSSSGLNGTTNPEMQPQAYPVYMLAVPIPPYLQPPDPSHPPPHMLNPHYPANG